MVRRIVLDGVPEVASSGVVIAPAIEEIVTRACDRDPSRRFSTARDMHLAIEALGRRTGWIATSAEVATEVEELLGMEIRARRAAIAARLSPAVPRALNLNVVVDVPPRTRRHASAASRRGRAGRRS